MTTTGGMYLGEMLLRYSSLVLDDSATGFERVWREILGGLLNPVRGFNRLIFGETSTTRSSPNQIRAPVHGWIHVTGSGTSLSSELSDAKAGGGVEFLLVYGDPFTGEEVRKPFDYFPVQFTLRRMSEKTYLNIYAYSLLAGKELSSKENQNHLVGLFQHYDFYNIEIVKLGGSSVCGGIISRFQLSPKVRLTALAHVGWMGRGSTVFPVSKKLALCRFCGREKKTVRIQVLYLLSILIGDSLMKNIQLRRKAMTTRRRQLKALFLVLGMCILFPSVGPGNTKDFQVKSSQEWQALFRDFHLTRDSSFGLSTGFADERSTNEKDGKVAIEVSAGLATYSSTHYGSGFRYGLGLLTDLSKRVALEFLLERYTVSVDEEAEELGAGKLQVTPVLFNLHFRFSEDRLFTPYALIGVGFYFFHFQPEDLEKGEEQEEDLVDRFSLLFGGGAEYVVSRKLALLAELRYCLIKTWMQRIDEIDVDPDEQTKITPNSLVLSLGIRYYF